MRELLMYQFRMSTPSTSTKDVQKAMESNYRQMERILKIQQTERQLGQQEAGSRKEQVIVDARPSAAIDIEVMYQHIANIDGDKENDI